MRSRPAGWIPPPRGFTLIELLIVLLIMATLVSVATPSIAQALRSNDIDAISGKMSEMMQFAYFASVSRRQPVMVSLDCARRRCRVTLRSLSLPWLQSEGGTPRRTLAEMTWPENIVVRIERNETSKHVSGESEQFETITFRSNGRTNDVVIEVTGRDNSRRFIEVVGRTGETRLREDASR